MMQCARRRKNVTILAVSARNRRKFGKRIFGKIRRTATSYLISTILKYVVKFTILNDLTFRVIRKNIRLLGRSFQAGFRNQKYILYSIFHLQVTRLHIIS